MPFENNGTLQKWHMTNTPPKIDKDDSHKRLVLYINGTPSRKLTKCHMSRAELSNFLKGILKFVV